MYLTRPPSTRPKLQLSQLGAHNTACKNQEAPVLRTQQNSVKAVFFPGVLISLTRSIERTFQASKGSLAQTWMWFLFVGLGDGLSQV